MIAASLKDLELRDYFTPSNWRDVYRYDWDMSCTSPFGLRIETGICCQWEEKKVSSTYWMPMNWETKTIIHHFLQLRAWQTMKTPLMPKEYGELFRHGRMKQETPGSMFLSGAQPPNTH